jgi:hypothetical protein
LKTIKLISSNIRSLNLAAVKLTTDQVTKLPLKHKIHKIGMICSVKPVPTKDFCIVQKEEFFNNMPYVPQGLNWKKYKDF